jgi:hypothetical protein
MGQPPKGERGELVSEYPKLMVRITPTAKRWLENLSLVERRPQWVIVDAAIRRYFEGQPAETRERIERARRKPNLRQFKSSDDE